jgi:hypothetical protein
VATSQINETDRAFCAGLLARIAHLATAEQLTLQSDLQ